MPPPDSSLKFPANRNSLGIPIGTGLVFPYQRNLRGGRVGSWLPKPAWKQSVFMITTGLKKLSSEIFKSQLHCRNVNIIESLVLISGMKVVYFSTATVKT